MRFQKNLPNNPCTASFCYCWYKPNAKNLPCSKDEINAMKQIVKKVKKMLHAQKGKIK